jgi:hypothetical protein
MSETAVNGMRRRSVESLTMITSESDMNKKSNVSRVARFFLVHDTKTGKYTKLCKTQCFKWSQNIPNVHKMSQMAIKYINIFLSDTLKIFPKLGFLV